jgi:hypothetical protein
MGYIRQRGAGRIVHLGCNPSRALLDAVLKEIQRPAACSCAGNQVQTVLHRHVSGRLTLYVINRADIPQLCQVCIDPRRNELGSESRWRVSDPDSEDALTLTTPDLQALLVQVGGHDVAIRIIDVLR